MFVDANIPSLRVEDYKKTKKRVMTTTSETQTVQLTEQTIGEIESAKTLSDIDLFLKTLGDQKLISFFNQVKEAPLHVLKEEMENRHRNSSLIERAEMSILTRTQKISFPE